MKKRGFVFIYLFTLLIISCENRYEQQNKEWQQRMEEEGKQMRKDIDHAIGKDDAMFEIKGGDNK